MPTLDAPEERMRKFKYRGKDASMRRQQRMAVSLELRKAKKDEQALKRRNITNFSPDPASGQLTKGVSLSLQEIINGVNASDPDLCFQATQAARKMLSQERNPPLKLIVEAGLIPRLVEFLKLSPHPCLQFEAAWALTNIASGPSEQTQAVVEGGAIQPLVELLSSPHMTVCEQAVWALGNIAGDGPEYRDLVISSNAIPHLLALVSSTIPITFLRNITWTLSNLCRNKNPYPSAKAVKQMLPVLSHLLQHQDGEVLSDTCWALSYLTDGSNERIGQVVNMGVLPRLVQLMSSSELNILVNIPGPTYLCPGLQMRMWESYALEQGLSQPPSSTIRSPTLSRTKLVICFSLVSATLYYGAFVHSFPATERPEMLTEGEFKVQKEAVWTVANFATGGTIDQLIQLVHSGVLEPLVNLLTIQDTKIVIIILDVLSFILQAAEKLSEKENLCLLIEEMGGIDKIEALQLHENPQVALTALNIIEKHFSEGEESGTILPALDQDHEFLNRVTKKYQGPTVPKPRSKP
ncbi:importin subunit alpha-8 [Ursus maritimus]|uniref:Importin subunit alpha n=1 Tax=Ursus maritimus TaxID=29073 RepID=A0A384CQH9_URSMA|nr:importin subunit alpha-8 [Ursus maritimus]